MACGADAGLGLPSLSARPGCAAYLDGRASAALSQLPAVVAPYQAVVKKAPENRFAAPCVGYWLESSTGSGAGRQKSCHLSAEIARILPRRSSVANAAVDDMAAELVDALRGERESRGYKSGLTLWQRLTRDLLLYEHEKRRAQTRQKVVDF